MRYGRFLLWGLVLTIGFLVLLCWLGTQKVYGAPESPEALEASPGPGLPSFDLSGQEIVGPDDRGLELPLFDYARLPDFEQSAYRAPIAITGQSRYVATEGFDESNDCLNVSLPCATPDYALEMANDGDTILVSSGVYTVYLQIHNRHQISLRAQDFQSGTLAGKVILKPIIHSNGMGRHVEIVDSSHVRVEGFEMTDGFANWGGAIHVKNSSDVALTNNNIHHNAAPATTDGGYLFMPAGGGVYIASSNHVLVEGNNICANQADHSSYGWPNGYGGGFYISNSTYEFYQNNICHNRSHDNGGGVYSARSTGSMTGNIVVENSSDYPGGGIYVFGGYDMDKVLSLTNNVIRDNRNSGLASRYVVLVIFHNTIVACQSEYCSGLWLIDNTYATLVNTIIVGDTSASRFNTPGDFAFVNVLKDNSWSFPKPGDLRPVYITGTVTVDELSFAPDGYHLLPGSTAQDVGRYIGVIEDIDGEVRPAGIGYDIGADEFHGPSLNVTKQASHNLVEPGTFLTYTVCVTNTGTITATNITITDALPVEVTWSGVDWIRTPPSTNWSSITLTEAGLIVWLDQMAVAEGASFELRVAVLPAATGRLTNVVQASSAEGAIDQDVAISRVVRGLLYFPLVMRE